MHFFKLLFFIITAFLFHCSSHGQGVDKKYLEEGLDLDSNEVESLKSLVSNDLRKGHVELTFLGDANIVNSLNTGQDISANTGIGVLLERFWLGPEVNLRQFELILSINVASTADTIFAELDQNTVINQRDFGSFLLIPENSRQSASLSSTIYFNRFQEYKSKVFQVISGAYFRGLGSNSNWNYNNENYNLAALSFSIGAFHEFIPDRIRYKDGYSIQAGMGYTSRWILGDINLNGTSDIKPELINTSKKSFHGIELFATFKFKNISAEVSIPFLLNANVPGLTKSQFVTMITFTGGFPLNISRSNKTNQSNGSQTFNKSTLGR